MFNFFRSLFYKLPTIKSGNFLVLHGEQGSGKSTLARKIAARRGKYAEIQSYDLNHTSALPAALADAPTTLIIEAEGFTRKGLEQLKILVTSKTITFRRPYTKQQETIPAPQVIVCTHDVEPFCDMRRAQLHLVRKA